MSFHPRSAALAAAAVLFAAYPILRPYSDESTLAGADAMSSAAWVVSHVAGMVAFLLLVAGFGAFAPSVTRSRRRLATVTGIGVGLVLPYYGAETLGIQVIARRALTDGDPGLLALTEQLRYGAVPMTMFGLGLLALALAGVLLVAHGSDWGSRLGAWLAGISLLTYLPQFFLPAAGRIAHGLLLAVGLILLAVAEARRSSTQGATNTWTADTVGR